MRKEIWLMIIMGIIIVALLAIFAFVPAKPLVNNQNQLQGIEGITITSPLANQEVSFPVEIAGYIDGKNGWTGFEGQVGTVRLISNDGIQVAGPAPLTAIGDWMKFPTQFGIVFDFSEGVGYIPEGTLVFYNENPSGEPARDRTFSLPIKIKPVRESMELRVYFMNENYDDNDYSCLPNSARERIVLKTEAVARAALEELLKGPNQIEKDNGLYTLINPGVKINSLTIDDKGVVKVDFSQELETTGGSCRATAIRGQITKTLEQFPTVKSVIISINGESETILQP